MSIQCEHSIEVSVTPDQAFALIDDLPRTPQWLGPCTALEKLSSGPNQVGDKLRYAYLQGGRAGVMDGKILERTEGRQLVCQYTDAQMEVVVDLRVSPIPHGSLLTHQISITPLTFLSKAMAPLIRMALPKQTQEAMTQLKALLESR